MRLHGFFDAGEWLGRAHAVTGCLFKLPLRKPAQPAENGLSRQKSEIFSSSPKYPELPGSLLIYCTATNTLAL
jgi:hypothetical protein